MSNFPSTSFKFQFSRIYDVKFTEDSPADVLAYVDQVNRYLNTKTEYVIRIGFADPDVTHDIDGNLMGIYAFVGVIGKGRGIHFLTRSGEDFENMASYVHFTQEVTIAHRLYAKSNLKRILNNTEIHLLSLSLILTCYFKPLY